jgi:hypothetical protein
MNTQTQQVEDDELEDEIEITLESDDSTNSSDNPNVADQLAVTPGAEEGANEEPKLTAEERMEQLMEGDEELKDYGQGVRKRINTLTYNWREAERQKDEAIRYAQKVQQEAQALRGRQHEQDGAYLGEAKARVEAQLDTAKRQLKEAHNLGDADLIADANANIGRFAAELAQVEATETQYKRRPAQPEQPPAQYQQPPPQQQYQQPPRQPAQPDPKANAWAEKNKWFGEDEVMTNAALTIHNTLVTQEGYEPHSDEYYNQIDSRLRKNFPHKFQKPRNDGQQMVTPGSNASTTGRKGGKKQVRLSASQVAIAKKLGVPLEEYAKYV